MNKTRFLTTLMATLFLVGGVAAQRAAPTTAKKNRVIIANLDKHPLTLWFGRGQRKDLAPRKATVVKAKRFPVQLKYWSGDKSLGYVDAKLGLPGVYDFRWRNGRWGFDRRVPPPPTGRTAVSAHRKPPRSYRRPTGSYTRVVRGPVTSYRRTYVNRPYYGYRTSHPGHRYGSRWTTWCRGVWGLGKLYQFVRDEEDRDLIRDIIVGREIGDAVDRDRIERELDRMLRDDAVNLPADQRRELERAIDEISQVDPADWKQISTLPSDEWDGIRDAIGDDITDAEWQNLEGWVDTLDEPNLDDASNLDEVGIDSLDADVDLADLADQEDLGGPGAEWGADLDDIDLGDITGDAGDLDLSDWDAGGLDLGDFDAGGSDEPGLLDDPGGLDLGGYDDGGLDFGGFDDAGGVDDFGGGFDDLGGGDFFDF